jgi:hypothetical protein
MAHGKKKKLFFVMATADLGNNISKISGFFRGEIGLHVVLGGLIIKNIFFYLQYYLIKCLLGF